jgi:hypothetical protein
MSAIIISHVEGSGTLSIVVIETLSTSIINEPTEFVFANSILASLNGRFTTNS